MEKVSPFLKIIFLLGLSFFILEPAWATLRYGNLLCQQEDFICKTVKKGESWSRLFPDPEQQDMMRRLNRMNIDLRPGMVLAIPKNLAGVTIYDLAPFPRYIEAPGEKTIYVSQVDLAWGAYDAQGQLLWWGPISSGRDWCSDIDAECTTPAGEYRIYRKQGESCVSTQFPVETEGGAPMPYCMHFDAGYALHGSWKVPGYRDSHGCVRLFVEDAKWLNENFITLPGEHRLGTRVIIGQINDNLAILKQNGTFS